MSPAPDTTAAPCRPAEAAAHTANPALATLAHALRGPMLPVIGFAELLDEMPGGGNQAWAHEVLTSSREMLEVLDCTLALLAGRASPEASTGARAAAEDAVAALRHLLRENTTDDCGAAQRRVA